LKDAIKRWLNGADKMNTLAKTTIIGATVVALMGSVGVAYAKKHEGKGQRMNFEQLDANSDGFITMDEMQAAHAARFAKNDANGDGFLDAEELAASHPKMGKRHKRGEEQSARKKSRMMRYMDENGDGKVALSEMPTDRLERMFAKLDTDGDSKISKAEMEARKGMKRHKNKEG
jgi:Ca2+-binding EF-hand superfamily protein